MTTDSIARIRLQASERSEREFEAQLMALCSRHTDGPGLLLTTTSRVDDVAAILHADGLAATVDGDRIHVGDGTPAWVVHVHPPATLQVYMDDLRQLDAVTEATLLSQPTDFARHRTAVADDVTSLAGVDAMQGYTEWAGCRHQALAGYVGQEHPGECGMCDTCAAPPAGLMGGEDARLAIDAVLQTGERFSAKHVIGVLLGERSETVTTHQHDKLDVWARGAHLSRPLWDAVLRQLICAGVLQVNDTGGLTAGPVAERVRSGEWTIRFVRHTTLPDAPMPKRRGVPRTTTAPTQTERTTKPRTGASGTRKPTSARAAELAKRGLYQWRTAYAAELGVPAIRILTDPDIARLIVRRPTTIEQLRTIITPSRADTYGDAILTALANL